ncbi:MAG: hypothetical protein RBG13Loki_3615 [Promethearchaeota archaeon CR_4]|nr:MAG: hypothetical protein RBG13Loki_3615 [Candidatus Lokiarchaeota archaeon CR_4]
MLEAIYVLDKSSGICLASYEIVKQTQSGDILSAFFLAALEFCKDQFHSTIHSIVAENKIVVLHDGSKIVLAGIIEKTDNPQSAAIFLEDIEREFLSIYERQIENYRGNVTVFRFFDPGKILGHLVYQRIIEESLAAL